MDWDEIGEGDKACQNPPELTEHDLFVYRWYQNCPLHESYLVRGFNLLPDMIADLELNPDEKLLFLKKLEMIYQAHLSIQIEKADKEGKENA